MNKIIIITIDRNYTKRKIEILELKNTINWKIYQRGLIADLINQNTIRMFKDGSSEVIQSEKQKEKEEEK